VVFRAKEGAQRITSGIKAKDITDGAQWVDDYAGDLEAAASAATAGACTELCVSAPWPADHDRRGQRWPNNYPNLRLHGAKDKNPTEYQRILLYLALHVANHCALAIGGARSLRARARDLDMCIWQARARQAHGTIATISGSQHPISTGIVQ
jgi:hypothetical protein